MDPHNIFDPSIISDHNAAGYDSVDSEDFDPGFGSVPLPGPAVIYAPPPMPEIELSDDDKWYYAELAKTEEQRFNEQMEYLKSKGIY